MSYSCQRLRQTRQNLHLERMLRAGGMTQRMRVIGYNTEQVLSALKFMLSSSPDHSLACTWAGNAKKWDIRWLDYLLHTMERLILTIIQKEWMPSSFLLFFSTSTWRNWGKKLIWHIRHLKQQRVWEWGYAICPFQNKVWSTGPCWFLHTLLI